MICAHCQTVNPDSAKFCRNCGNALQSACANCGSPMSAGDRFCTACGQPANVSTSTDDTRLKKLNTAVPASLADKIRSAEISSDRKVVTALFADVVGSTTLAEQMDAEEWTGIMNRAFDVLSPPIYRYEGTIARLLGDALLAFFGAPVAHEDDPVRAVYAGLELLAAARQYAEQVRREHGIDFAVRVGINTGPVVVGNVGSDLKFEYTAMGDAVNLAARMQSAARPMTVLISHHTHKFVTPFFDCTDLGVIEVKGKAEPIRAYEVRMPKASPGRARGLVGLESPMVGRSTELEGLCQLSGIVQAGAGRAAAILGEPGLGKSRLIAEWKAAVNQTSNPTLQPMRWSEGQCLSYGQDLAYHLILSTLRSLIGVSAVASETETQTALHHMLIDLFGDEAGEVYPYLAHLLSLHLEPAEAERINALDPQSLQSLYVSTFRRLLQEITKRTPLTLILEDIHWADPSSVDLLIKLLPLAFQSRLLFCFVSRVERDTPGWKLITAAHEMMGDTMLESRLSPLSETDSRQLVTNLLEIQALPDNIKALIYRKAEGNPFFVEEVIRMLIDRAIIVREGDRWVSARQIETVDIPDTLLGLLLARIDRQPDDVKRTMRIASVIGRQFPVKVLEQVMEREEAVSLATRLSTLEAANLIRLAQVEPDLEYLFRHALIQDAAYESLLKKDRQRLHLAVGRILEHLYAERLEDLAPVLSHHFNEAGSLSDAQRYFILAADSAARKYANQEAIMHYSKAIEVSPKDDVSLPRLYRARGLIHEVCGSFDLARADHETALELARAGLNRRAEWQAILDLGMLWAGRDYGQAGDYFQQSFKLAEELADPALLAQSLNRVGNWLANREEPLEGIRYHQQALALFQSVNNEQGLGETYDLLAMASWLGGQADQAIGYSHKAVDLLRRSGNKTALVSCLSAMGTLGSMGDLAALPEPDVHAAEALQYVDEALNITRSMGFRSGEAFALALRGRVYFTQGQCQLGMDNIQQALGIATEIEHKQWVVLATHSLAGTYAELGLMRTAYDMLAPLFELARAINSIYWFRSIGSVLAHTLIWQGRLEEAEQVLDSVLPVDEPAQTFSQRTAWVMRAELLYVQGKFAESLKVMDHLLNNLNSADPHIEDRIIRLSLLRGQALTALIQQYPANADTLTAQAEHALQAAIDSSQPWPKPLCAWQAHASLGKLYRILNRPTDAEREFASARSVANQLAANLPTELCAEFLQGVEAYIA